MEGTAFLLLSAYTFFSFLTVTHAVLLDTITANETVRDGTTIQSANGDFELGFFSPGTSKNRYLGIWYKKIATGKVVWVANREAPLSDTSGMLRVNLNGNYLVITEGANSIIWSSNSPRSAMNPVAQLLDSGNLVIRNENDSDPENFLWQSFDHPGDTILPTMKFGWDLVKGLNRNITSWKSADDPSQGKYTNGIDLNGYPTLSLWKGTTLSFRYGPWNGIQFGGRSSAIQNPVFTYTYVFNQKEIYYEIQLLNNSIAMKLMVTPNGKLEFQTWMDGSKGWEIYASIPADYCDNYGFCGPYGSCNITNAKLGNDPCECLTGFEPKFPDKWKLGDRSNGCGRKTKLGCGFGDRFEGYPGLKLPDTQHSWIDQRMNLEECERVCLKNCSCTAYASLDIKESGSGCLLWFGDLIDIREYKGNGQDIFVRIGHANGNFKAKRRVKMIIIVVSVALLVLSGLFLIHIFRKRKLNRKMKKGSDATNKRETENLELPLFDLVIIANATQNFSENNKLGQGGFGPVYKGILEDGQEIAVKRLSKTSKQGLQEFKNEVSCIAKLQHRNLVRLLGCCVEEGEMLLIYEYMPNNSLDSFIFDKEVSKTLDWAQRYNIINGIAKGLLYLHEDSRLRIIHRDLKTSNILLDFDLHPKISDFGLARTFGGTEAEVNTTKVVGTYGYMSPEYAIDGIFSIKSDIYSFGVVVLEIVSGQKVRGPTHNLNLIGHAWKLYKEGKFLELIDGAIAYSCNQSQVLRAIQIGLLCVQPYPRDRPSIPFIVQMLTGENELPQPKPPGFYTEKKVHELDTSPSSCNQRSTISTELTVTFLSPR